MTTLGSSLAAEQNRLLVERLALNNARNPPLSHEFQEGQLILLPGYLLLPIRPEQLVGWRKPQIVLVSGIEEGGQEVRKVFSLAETCQLRAVI
jgi:hypothetical protein